MLTAPSAWSEGFERCSKWKSSVMFKVKSCSVSLGREGSWRAFGLTRIANDRPHHHLRPRHAPGATFRRFSPSASPRYLVQMRGSNAIGEIAGSVAPRAAAHIWRPLACLGLAARAPYQTRALFIGRSEKNFEKSRATDLVLGCLVGMAHRTALNVR
jgi:hypothetical protein